VFGRDPGTGVGEGNPHTATRLTLTSNAQRSPRRHGLTRVQREIEERLAQHRRIAVDVRDAVTVDCQGHAALLRFRPHDWHHLVHERRHAQRLQLEILGARELQEPLQHLIEPPDLVGDDVDMFQGRGRRLGGNSRDAGSWFGELTTSMSQSHSS
jgi:hypothetical protein